MAFIDRIKSFWADEETDDAYEEMDTPVTKKAEAEARAEEEPRSYARKETKQQKVVNIHATAQLQVALFKPESYGDEILAIADELNKMHTVVLNLENADKDVSRRIVDFLSGVAYSRDGKIKRIAANTFIIIPNTVDLVGEDVLDEIENQGVYF